MDRHFALTLYALGVMAVFALLMWTMAWINSRASGTAKTWAIALIASFAVTDLPYWAGIPNMEMVSVSVDVALGLAAALDFCFDWRNEGGKRPMWLVALLVSYIAQLMFHLNDDSDKAMELNVAFAVQILLVSNEQLCQRLNVCLSALLRPLRYSHGAAARCDRGFTRWLGGPPHRAHALRRASRQAHR